MGSEARKVLVFAASSLALWLGLRYLMPVVLPFALGAVMALAAEPGVKFLCSRLHLPRGLAAGITVSGVFLIICVLITMVLTLLFRELGLLAGVLPEMEQAVMEKIMNGLSEGVPARRVGLTEEEQELLGDVHLLTMKPILYVTNVAEGEVADTSANPHVQAVKKYAAEEGSEVIVVSAKMESEIAELDAEEAAEFLAMAGLEETGLDRLIKAGFKLLGLMTFLTAGEIESRAWTIKQNTKAPQAAGKIHTDFERGFIRAEIVSYDDLVACGSKAAAREKGLVRLEGKDYVMQDGDVVEFRFNV